MSGGNDPLVVEDWSAYEKSMLEVLREERRTRLKLVPVERPMSPEELRQFVQGKVVERAPVERSVSDAAPQPADLPLFPGQAEQAPLLAVLEVEPPGAAAASRPAPIVPLEKQDEPALRSSSLLTPHSLPPTPARLATLRWRVPVLVSAVILSVTAAAVTIVKPERGLKPAPEAAISQSALAGGDSGAAVDAIAAPANDPGKSGNEAPGGNEGAVSGDRVRMRGAPATDAPVLLTLRRGAAVTITERSALNDWCRIQANDGREGWMKCDFLKKTGPTPRD